MTQTLREQLLLTQEDLAMYLGVSPETLKSMELGRRRLPTESMKALAVLYQLRTAFESGDSTGDPLLPASGQIRNMKRLHSKWSRRLENYTDMLEKMRKSYATACAHLAFYQQLAEAFSQASTANDRARRKWTQFKIDETEHRIRQNNITAQEILSAKISGLKSMVKALESSVFFPFNDAK